MGNQSTVAASALTPTTGQQLFVRYLFAILFDLVVLNLFAEYWDRVSVESFTVSLLVAVLLQVLLQLTMKIEHRIADHFKSKTGTGAKIGLIASVWGVLIISKFVILGAIGFFFGEQVHFEGAMHGVVPFLVVIIVMIVAEEVVVRFYHRFDKEPAADA